MMVEGAPVFYREINVRFGDAALITALDFYKKYEPRILDLMLDIEAELKEDNERALGIAQSLGLDGDVLVQQQLGPNCKVSLAALPLYVWELVYASGQSG
jgi:hypothetical protein